MQEIKFISLYVEYEGLKPILNPISLAFLCQVHIYCVRLCEIIGMLLSNLELYYGLFFVSYEIA